MVKLRYLASLDMEAFTEAARGVPYQRVHSDLFPNTEIWVRRDDLIDPILSGNKAYKLLYNLIEAREQGADTLITCGGAWSNHIHATAAAGARFGFKSVGIIRGERPPVLSATLRDVQRFGMRLRFVTRKQYRLRDSPGFPGRLGVDMSRAVYIPEGGANLAGARGVQLLGKIIGQSCPINFNQIWLACGTGLTLAGLRSSVTSAPIYGVEVLKAGNSIRREAQRWLQALQSPSPLGERGWGEGDGGAPNLFSRYHCGGYAKYPRYLREFQQTFERETNIPLDPVYTVKLMYCLHREATDGRLPRDNRILALHSGGLQGRRGYYLRRRPD